MNDLANQLDNLLVRLNAIVHEVPEDVGTADAVGLVAGARHQYDADAGVSGNPTSGEVLASCGEEFAGIYRRSPGPTKEWALRNLESVFVGGANPNDLLSRSLRAQLLLECLFTLEEYDELQVECLQAVTRGLVAGIDPQPLFLPFNAVAAIALHGAHARMLEHFSGSTSNRYASQHEDDAELGSFIDHLLKNGHTRPGEDTIRQIESPDCAFLLAFMHTCSVLARDLTQLSLWFLALPQRGEFQAFLVVLRENLCQTRHNDDDDVAKKRRIVLHTLEAKSDQLTNAAARALLELGFAPDLLERWVIMHVGFLFASDGPAGYEPIPAIDVPGFDWPGFVPEGPLREHLGMFYRQFWDKGLCGRVLGADLLLCTLSGYQDQTLFGKCLVAVVEGLGTLLGSYRERIAPYTFDTTTAVLREATDHAEKALEEGELRRLRDASALVRKQLQRLRPI